MEKQENNEKRRYDRDPLKKVVREYKAVIASVKEQFALIVSGAMSGKGRNLVKIQSPDFVEIVLMPIVGKLAEMLPEYDVEQFAKEEIEPDDRGFFLIRVAGKVVAGICFGGVETEYHIKVALFPSNKPWGKPVVVKSMNDLRYIVELAIKIMDIGKKANNDTGK